MFQSGRVESSCWICSKERRDVGESDAHGSHTFLEASAFGSAIFSALLLLIVCVCFVSMDVVRFFREKEAVDDGTKDADADASSGRGVCRRLDREKSDNTDCLSTDRARIILLFCKSLVYLDAFID